MDELVHNLAIAGMRMVPAFCHYIKGFCQGCIKGRALLRIFKIDDIKN